ncbi:hypothetical protein [Nitrosomonas oligotropha]|uniref:HTH cro/C1-type domain-containing protein n=1 Tax=Nitrosomonas oligotropha TaxID=42354 RepID=A0A1H8RP48_9PROT|nr:hypothetical protein [Nitrosomonas oligotropha]SDX03327.1 hypothetical protein SAMN05216300_11615 [Nitrosomonas oligotropha]SEO67723.1 hypothetical protein SAMN05216333_11515 [Nitrosomonas oligotropha]
MKMKNYIEEAEKKAGMQLELAKLLNISSSNIRSIKAGKRGLPVEACIILADYIGADRLEVIAASNLVTEKDEGKRKILESCFQKVASITAAAVISSILTLTPQQTVKAENLNSQFTKIQIIGNRMIFFAE